MGNNLHYDSLDFDPTLDHFEQVKNWGCKWLSEGQVSQEIATWVVNLEPKPGVAFWNVKTQKGQPGLSHYFLLWYGNRTTLITLITITNQTVSRALLVNTIVAYLVLFCF